MPNLVPLVEIDLDKPRHLRLDLNAMCEFERVAGKPFFEINRSMQDTRILLWVALIHEDPDLTQEEAGAFCYGGNLPLIDVALAKAMQVAMPEPTGAPPQKNRRRSTGSKSGPSGDTTSD